MDQPIDGNDQGGDRAVRESLSLERVMATLTALTAPEGGYRTAFEPTAPGRPHVVSTTRASYRGDSAEAALRAALSGELEAHPGIAPVLPDARAGAAALARMRSVLVMLGDPLGGLDLLARLLDASGVSADPELPNVAAMLRVRAREARAAITGDDDDAANDAWFAAPLRAELAAALEGEMPAATVPDDPAATGSDDARRRPATLADAVLALAVAASDWLDDDRTVATDVLYFAALDLRDVDPTGARTERLIAATRSGRTMRETSRGRRLVSAGALLALALLVPLAGSASATEGTGSSAAAPVAPARFLGMSLASAGLARDGERVEAQTPQACSSRAYRFFGRPWRTTFEWHVALTGKPDYLGGADIIDAARSAVRNIADARNDCGRADDVELSTRYLGRTDQRPGITTKGACKKTDGFNVVGFGRLPAEFVAFSCQWWSNGEAIESDIKINTRYRLATQLSGCEGATYLLEEVLTHEFGHTFGLGHVKDPSQTMYPDTASCSLSKTTLGRGDLLGLEKRY